MREIGAGSRQKIVRSHKHYFRRIFMRRLPLSRLNRRTCDTASRRGTCYLIQIKHRIKELPSSRLYIPRKLIVQLQQIADIGALRRALDSVTLTVHEDHSGHGWRAAALERNSLTYRNEQVIVRIGAWSKLDIILRSGSTDGEKHVARQRQG
jgi:hypothetical protein